MGFIGRLLGSPKALGEMVKAVGDGLDKFIYTKQEKSEDASKAITEGRNMIIRWMETTQGQNLARRIIALLITFVWLLMFLTRMGFAIAAIWISSPEKWNASAEIIGNNIQQMTGAVMLILGFYFASPYLGKITNVAMNKFSLEQINKEKQK